MQLFDAPNFPEFIQNQIQRCGQPVKLEAGAHFLRPGMDVELFAVIQSGSLRVYTAGGQGREITLYTVEPGECCLINVLCLISGMKSPAYAVADETIQAVAFSRATFLNWLAEREDVRQFVFGIMAGRVSGMMALVEEVAFQRLDCRLAAYLLQRGEGSDELILTHEAVAGDLGTAREVVSRLLKAFERQGAVELSRGRITLRDREALRQLVC
jgi:CRP/FNR family transcriptional regulator